MKNLTLKTENARMHTSMYQFSRPRRSPRREVLSLHQSHAEASGRGVQSDTAPSGPTANNEQVEGVYGAGPDEGRLLHGPQRDHGALVGYFPLDGARGGGAGSAVVGGDGGVPERSVSGVGEDGSGGCGGGAQTCGHWCVEGMKRWDGTVVWNVRLFTGEGGVASQRREYNSNGHMGCIDSVYIYNT